MKDIGLKIVLDEATIQQRLDVLAAEIDALYKDKPLVVVCVLKGAFMFFTDLVRRLTCNPMIDFVQVGSYGYDTRSQHVTFIKDMTLPVQGKDVLLIEDIIDTGRSMEFLLPQLASRGANSLRLAVFVDKNERREVNIQADFVAFSIPKGFIVGYGLDYGQAYRNLPAVYEVLFDEKAHCALES